MESNDLVESFLGLQDDQYQPGFDVQFTTFMQKYSEFRSHNFAVYFFHVFLGFVFTIPETYYAKDLGIRRIIFKSMKDQAGLKFVFLVKDKKAKKTMIVRNVFFKPVSKNWERGITSSEYEGLRLKLQGEGVNLNDYARNLEEYHIREEEIYKDKMQYEPDRRMNIYLQKLRIDPRMISSEEGARTAENNFKIIYRMMIHYQYGGDPYQRRLEDIIRKVRNIYHIPSHRAYTARNLKTIQKHAQNEYGLQNKWNGAECAFMHGAFLALESKLGLLPHVRHIPGFEEFDSVSEGMYGRFYLSLIPKRTFALMGFKFFKEFRLTAMSFVRDILPTQWDEMGNRILSPSDERNLLQDHAMLAKHAVTSTSVTRERMLLFQIDLEDYTPEPVEVPIDNHEDFLEKCDQMYDNIVKARSDASRRQMTDYVANFLDSISPQSSSKDIKEVNYVSRYFLAMLFTMKGHEKWNIFVKEDGGNMLFILRSESGNDKKIVFEFVEHPMKEKSVFRDSPSHSISQGVVKEKIIHVLIQEDFLHSKEDFSDSETILDLVSRKVAIGITRSTMSDSDLVRVDPFALDMLIRYNEILESPLSDLFKKYHAFIRDKHQLSAFVDGLFHNAQHAKNFLPMKPYQSNKQITYFDSEGDKIHLNFFLTMDKETVADRQAEAMAQLRKFRHQLRSKEINILINKDEANTEADDVVHVQYSDALEDVCPARRKRSGVCEDEKPMLPKDMESSHSSSKIGRAVENLGKISSYLMTGFMIRDFIADLIRQDSIGAVRDGTCFVGSIFSHKLASIAEAYGVRMVEENNMLIGNSFKFAGPVLRRLTSAYVLSSLISSFQQYRNDRNNTAALVNIGVDSAFLTIDAAETSIEVMELSGVGAVEGLSATTGPLGMAIGAVLILGSNIYETVKKMEMINKAVPISAEDEIIETFRSFFHLDISLQVRDDISELEANEILAKLIKSQLDSQNRFKYYITSSGEVRNGKILMLNDTVIDLQDENSFIKSKANPRDYKIFCPMSVSLREHKRKLQKEKSLWRRFTSLFTDTYWGVKGMVDALRQDFVSVTLDLEKIDSEYLGHGYACHNSFGLIIDNVQANSAFYQLNTGYDRVHGFLDKPNVYNLSDGLKIIYGGNIEDTFILNGDYVKGILDGEGGINTLDVSRFNLQCVLYVNNSNIAAGNSTFMALNVTKFIGRRNVQEVIDVPCGMTMLDSGGGGSARKSDQLHFKNSACGYNVTVILSSFTKVYVDGMTNGIFNYIVKPEASDLHMQVTQKSINLITFNCPMTSITEFKLYRRGLLLSKNHAVYLQVHDISDNLEIMFSDNVIVKVKSGHISALLKTDLGISKILNVYDEFLRHNSMSMVAFSTVDQKTLSFNHGRYQYITESAGGKELSLNVIHNDQFHENEIVCPKDQQNVVLVRRTTAQSPAEFRIPDIHVHCKSSDLIIDLSNISQTVCESWPERDVKVTSDSVNTEGKLIINVDLVSESEILAFGRMYVYTDSRERIKIINYDHSKIIKKVTKINNAVSAVDGHSENTIVKQTLIIAPEPWHIQKNSTFVLITDCNIEWYQTVHIPKVIENFGIYRINETAVVTNLDEKMIYDRKNLLVVLLENYFDSEKLKSIRMLDVNRKMLNLAAPLDTVSSMDDLWKKFVANDNFYYN